MYTHRLRASLLCKCSSAAAARTGCLTAPFGQNMLHGNKAHITTTSSSGIKLVFRF